MTHPADVVEHTIALGRQGLSASAIAPLVGVPRRTVVDWLAGRTPGRPKKTQTWPLGRSAEGRYVHLLGLYLGDGCLAEHPRDVFKLRITLDAAYPAIIDECAASMRAVLPGSRVIRFPRRYNDIEVYSYSKHWPALFPQHGPGKKHERPIALERWQTDLVLQHPRSLLRGLIQSDGCRFANTGRNWYHPRYSFFNYSDDIRAIFCDACDMLGVRWTTAPRTVYVSRKADVARLDEFIGPKA